MRCLSLAFLFAGALSGQTAFEPAPYGCAMAHCDTRMSDLVRLQPPLGPTPVIIAHDPLPTGSGLGLGCVSNGRTVACSYNSPSGDTVIAYDAQGTRLWTSGALLNSSASASAPMINATGGVIAADDAHVIRFTARGAVVWDTLTPGGIPLSPVTTASGAIILATKGGPVSAYDSATGHLIGSLYIRESPSDPGYFDTLNTPCVSGNRVYISTARVGDPANRAWLVALDIDVNNPAEPLKLAWHYEFGGPSGASPLLLGNTIFFDGDRPSPGTPYNPHLFAVRDTGLGPALLWTQAVPASVPASLAQDPRGGVWSMYKGYGKLERRAPATGQLVETLDIPALVADPLPNLPYSALTMAGTAQRPLLLIGTNDRQAFSSYVIAIDLTRRSLLWKLNLAAAYPGETAPKQFPIAVNTGGHPVVVFSGRFSGAYFLSTP